MSAKFIRSFPTYSNDSPEDFHHIIFEHDDIRAVKTFAKDYLEKHIGEYLDKLNCHMCNGYEVINDRSLEFLLSIGFLFNINCVIK